ncbi:glycoside hydrolase family 3 protein [Anaerotignum sp.]|uniref:glycoside hydrolase family 3 protein n=1 Tax=Anaerotignum sp. TaxID=2039241 RepID=UPI002A908792|nr:glycoside hydrolase family 3 protein [Anaerotignum sp.]MCI7656947.1 glycoside hydrolase family 3 protein [Clostridia bacterium]MDY5414783.1 glycoside hydrolase family 3 protein [Anaerotignum sp.]
MKKSMTFLLAAAVAMFAGCGQEETAEKQPEVTVEKTAEELKEDAVAEMLENMTVEEKVGQMLMMDFRKNPDDSGMTVLSEDVAQKIADYHLGGVILFAENLDTAEQTKKLVADMQKAADIPLLIGIDEEGGMVSRLDKSQIPHTSIPNAKDMNGDTAQAEAAGEEIGSVLSELGINVDFAPIADIHTNPENTVIGDRAYGTDAQTVADMASAFTKGLENKGVSATAKHFPGHGDTRTDSHDGMAISEHDLQRLEEVEFVPFHRLAEEGIDLMMVGHITMPNVTEDGLPASLSKEAIDLLREELDYDGIVITDAMNMGAIVEYYPDGEAAVKAVEAGVDIVLMPADLDDAYNSLCEAVQIGEISEERLDESVERILSLKYDKGMLVP